MLMYKPDGGFCNFSEGEVKNAVSKGWVDGTLIHKAALDAKNPAVPLAMPLANTKETDTIQAVEIHPQEPQKRGPGRPKLSVRNGHGDGADST